MITQSAIVVKPLVIYSTYLHRDAEQSTYALLHHKPTLVNGYGIMTGSRAKNPISADISV